MAAFHEAVSFLRDFNLFTVALRLVLAMAMGGVIGAERGKHGRALDFISDNFRTSDFQVTEPHSGAAGHVGIEVNIHNRDHAVTPEQIAALLEQQDYVIFALESI